MAKSKTGDSFSVDFTGMFGKVEPTKDKAAAVHGKVSDSAVPETEKRTAEPAKSVERSVPTEVEPSGVEEKALRSVTNRSTPSEPASLSSETLHFKAESEPLSSGTLHINADSSRSMSESLRAKDDEPLVDTTDITGASAADEPLLSVTIYLPSEEDRMYLKFRSKELGLSVSDFLWQMIENDDVSKADLTDARHEKYRQGRLSISTTVRFTAKQKRELVKHAAKHRLFETRYVGWLVEGNREADGEW